MSERDERDDLEQLVARFIADLELAGYEPSQINGAMVAATRDLMERNIGPLGALLCFSAAVTTMARQIAHAVEDIGE